MVTRDDILRLVASLTINHGLVMKTSQLTLILKSIKKVSNSSAVR